MTAFLEYWLLPAASLLAIVDPVAAAPTFLTITAGDTPQHRKAVVLRAALVCVGVLAVFALGGKIILGLFAVTLPAFRIAGGVILILLALDMLQARRRSRATQDEIKEGIDKLEVAVTPLAFPLLAGPGAISTVMILMARAEGWADTIPVYVAILSVGIVTFVTLRVSGPLLSLVGQTGVNLLSRLMGIFLLTIAVQFVLDGLKEAGFSGAP